MTIEQRKLELISWLSSVQNEKIIEGIEELKNNPNINVPDMIVNLIKKSSQAAQEDCVEHTNVKNLIGRKKKD